MYRSANKNTFSVAAAFIQLCLVDKIVIFLSFYLVNCVDFTGNIFLRMKRRVYTEYEK
jgi:hypothetical protein